MAIFGKVTGENPPRANSGDENAARITDIDVLTAKADEANSQPFEVPELAQDEINWVIGKEGGIPVSITRDVEEKLIFAGCTQEQIRQMTPVQAHFLLLGGAVAYRAEAGAVTVDDTKNGTTRESAPLQEARHIGVEKDEAEGEIAISEKRQMEDTEGRYLEAYKQFIATRKKWEEEPEELIRLKSAYDEARVKYGVALQESAEERASERIHGKYQDLPIKSKEKLIERYNSLVRYREIIKGPAERKLQARYDALDSKGKSLFQRGLIYLGQKNAKLEERFGKNGARAVRAVAATVGVGTVAAGAGAFAGAGLLAVAGWGTMRIGKTFLSSIAGAALGEGAASVADRMRQGKQVRDERQTRRSAQDLSIGDLEQQDVLQDRITEKMSDRERMKHKMLVRIITGFGVGAGTSALLATLPSVEAAVTENGPAAGGSTPAEMKDALRATVEEVEKAQPKLGYVEMPLDDDLSSGTTDVPEPLLGAAAPVSPDAPAGPESGIQSPTAAAEGILEESDGANELLFELREKLIAQYGPELKGAPDYVKHFVNDETMLERSREFGFMTEKGNVLVHSGAKLSFDTSGQLVLEDSSGVGKVALMDTQGNAIAEGVEKVREHVHLSTDTQSAVPAPLTVEAPSAYPAAGASSGTTLNPEAAPTSDTAVSNGASPVTPPEITRSEVPVSMPDKPSVGAESMESWIQSHGQDALTQTQPKVAIDPIATAPVSETESGSRTEAVPIETWVAQHEAAAAASEQPVSPTIVPESAPWQPGMSLPSESAVFSMQGAANQVFVHASTPEQSFQMAQEYARTHPGTRVYFDNPQARMGGLLSPAPRIGSLEFDQQGNPNFKPQAIDEQGKPITSIAERLASRIER